MKRVSTNIELLKINPDNTRCYSKDFIKGFECGTKRQFEADMRKYKRGKWNKPDYGMCSNCHRYAPETENGFYLSDFCPNCGARMKGADDETD